MAKYIAPDYFLPGDRIINQITGKIGLVVRTVQDSQTGLRSMMIEWDHIWPREEYQAVVDSPVFGHLALLRRCGNCEIVPASRYDYLCANCRALQSD